MAIQKLVPMMQVVMYMQQAIHFGASTEAIYINLYLVSANVIPIIYHFLACVT